MKERKNITVDYSAVSILILILSLFCITAWGQSDEEETEKLKKEKELLQLQKEVAELQKAIAEAEKARMKALLPEITPLEGKITTKDYSFESELSAYEEMRKTTDKILAAIITSDPKVKALVIHGERLVNSMLLYSTYQAQKAFLTKQYEDALGETKFGALLDPVVPGLLLKAGIDLLALFRTEIDYSGFVFTVEEAAVVSALAEKFQASPNHKQVQIIYPQLYNVDMNPADGSALEQILTDFQILYAFKAKAEVLIKEFEAKPKDEQDKSPDKPKILRLKALNQQFETFVNNLIKLNETTGLTPLTTILFAAQTADFLDQENSYVLYLKVIKASGSNRISRNLFTGSKIRHSGGAIVNFILFDRNSVIKASNVIDSYSGFKEMKSEKEKQ